MADLLISVGDYVIVQDGVIDQPKIVVWDNVSLAESVSGFISSFPSTAVLDDFNRANEALLAGPNWAYWTFSATGFALTSNTIRPTGAFLASSDYWTASFAAASEVYLTVTTCPGSGGSVSLGIRISSPDGVYSGYVLTVSNAVGTFTGTLRRYDAGTPTVLASSGVSLANGDVIGIRAAGYHLSVWHNSASSGSVSLIDHDDSTYAAEGYIAVAGIDTTGTLVLDNFGGGSMANVFITAFDAIVTEDPGNPNIIQSLPISVFDSVRVQEGQSDSDVISISVVDDVTVIEDVSGSMNLLRITIFDNVTVVDVPSVFAQGALGSVSFDSVIVQEQQTVYLSLYINAFDLVIVSDGAVGPEVFDAVTVVEDITVKLARLVIAVFDAVTVTDAQTVFGPAIDVGASVFEDVVISESVTVLLTNLVPTVSSDVTVSESVTVSLSSINLNVNVSDSVTVVESLTVQTNPIQINEFTEVLVQESVSTVSSLIFLNVYEDVTVADVVANIQTLPIKLLTVFEDIAVTERVVVRIGIGRKKRHDLPIVGVGD